MDPIAAQEQLIRLGVASIEHTQTSPADRAAMLEAAARLLPESSDFSTKCSVTAACIKQAEEAQLTLFQSARS